MPKTTADTRKKFADKSKLQKTGTVKNVAAAENSFPIVAIGASSGGLEAISELLRNLAPDTGMAYIFIQHLSPDYKSILASLMARSTKMLVQEIEDMELMKPDNVYVIPYNKGIEVTDGHIKLIPRSKKVIAVSIDVLFTSLAETHKENAIGIVLSGNATDGTMGLRAIKREGGITFAQDNSAKFGSMPQSAISEGVADFILSPKEIALELGRISKHASKSAKILKPGDENKLDDGDPELKAILKLLHDGIGVDFSQYKMATVKRRILRRMFFYKLAALSQYVKLLKTDSRETGLLYNDLLINVTDFFRDEEAIEHLKTILLPQLIKNKKPRETFKIWIVACATGQEAYSMAMLVSEILGDKMKERKVQIFATDLSEQAIKKARTGEYSKEDVTAISPKRLERFFTKVNGNYRVTKSLRDLCSFAPHNILSNPPFSKIDIISCCNMLIYLDTALQKKVLSTFHYALNDSGYLILGKAETISSSTLFTPVNRRLKIFERKPGVRSQPDLTALIPRTLKIEQEIQSHIKTADTTPVNTSTEINTILFSRFIPAYVIINHAMTILEFKGDTYKYLEHSTGKATLNILNMARPEIAFELLEAIHAAIDTKKEIRRSGVEIKNDDIPQTVTIDVFPLKTYAEDPVLLIVFTGQPQHDGFDDNLSAKKSISVKKQNSIKQLKEEVAVVRAELISLGEENDKANKILQTAKEQILSRNEEFQCLNEELETSKEEIESTNEELITTNQELQTRNEQLTEANDFSEAIVTTLHEPMIILDKDLRVKSANKAFYKKFLVLQVDTEGKLLYELGNHQWDIPPLRELLEKIIPKESSFYDYEITHIFPYIGRKTMLLNAKKIVQEVRHEQLILLAFTDISERSQGQKNEKKELEDIILERTNELEKSYKTLKEKNASLEKMNKELETFTFVSSHDLQEPLRKIKNFASCLLDEEKEKLSETGKEYLQRMQETAKRMQMLIEDLLAYSRVKNAKHVFEKTDLNVVVSDVIADFTETIKEKKATIKTAGLCTVNIIPFQIRQLFSNLISNSLKFSHASRYPKILFRSKTVSGRELNNSALLPGTKYCHMTFTDNGIGFDPQYKDRIFEVFQRLHEYEEYKGTGIGLAICKRIVENHNGIMTATGTLDKGAKFDIYIPVGQ